jgi:hypothetical protein
MKKGQRTTASPEEPTINPTSLMTSEALDEALRFLALLGKDPDTSRLRFFANKHNPRKQQIGARKLVGVDAELIAQYQREGRGAYVAIGNSDGKGDEKKNIINVPALFNEWDDKPVEWQCTAWKDLGLPEPSIQVETGGASVHSYWLLDTPITRDEWEPFQKRLIEHSGSDPACSDASRVMRMPGAWYIGPDGQPVAETKIISASGKRYSPDEVVPDWMGFDEFGSAPEAEPVTRGAESAARSSGQACDYPPRTLDEIHEALSFIPQRKAGTKTYEMYRNILWGLIKACQEAGSDQEMAIALMEAHSPSAASGWNIEQVARSGGEEINANTFFWHAQQHGWDASRRRHSAADAFDGFAVIDDDNHQGRGERQQQLESFQVLGWCKDREKVWYRHRQTAQIASVKPSGQAELLKLADLSYWGDRYPRQDKDGNKIMGINWARAAADLIKAANNAGVFQLEKMRGRGVWLDAGQVVWHLGHALEVDGQPVRLTDHRSAHQYALMQSLPINTRVEPLDDAHGQKILQVLRDCAWIGASDHLHLAGFCVLSSVCGALDKRPGLQITSPFSSGKTDTIDNVIMPLQGGIGLLSSGSTEAGVRQLLGTDALPATIDESEAEEGRRREAQLRLVRFSYDGKPQFKGTPWQGALTYCLRSSLALAGINSPIDNPADGSRIAVISRRILPDEQWQPIRRRREQVITEEIGQRLIRRTVSTLLALRANIATFKKVVAAKVTTGEAGRTGDTWGALLAGAHHLISTQEISEAEAAAWLDSVGWHLSHTNADEQDRRAGAEGRQCLDHLLSHETRWIHPADRDEERPTTGSVALRELVAMVKRSRKFIDKDEAEKELGRKGIRVMLEGLAVANSAAGTSVIFGKTKWANGAHKGRLLELDGAQRCSGPIHFVSSGSRRAVLVPWAAVGDLGDFEPAQAA